LIKQVSNALRVLGTSCNWKYTFSLYTAFENAIINEIKSNQIKLFYSAPKS